MSICKPHFKEFNPSFLFVHTSVPQSACLLVPQGLHLFSNTGDFSHFPQLELSRYMSRTEVSNNNVLIYLEQVRALQRC